MSTVGKETEKLLRELKNENKLSELRDHEREEIRTLWQIVTSDLEFSKLQQYKITYYAIIIYISIIVLFIRETALLLKTYMLCGALSIGLFVCCLSSLFLWEAHKSILRSRLRLNDIHFLSSHLTKTIWGHRSEKEKSFYTLFFIISTVAGFIVLFVLLYNFQIQELAEIASKCPSSTKEGLLLN